MLPFLQDRRQQEALKVALAALFAGLIVLWMHADNPFWAPALVIVFMSDYLESSISNSIVRVVSTLLGGFAAIPIASLTLHNEFIYVIVLCFIVTLCTYCFLVYGSGWLNFAVTFSFIYLYLLYFPHGGFDIAYWRVLQVTLAALTWVFVSAYLFPNHAIQASKKSFANAIKQFAIFLNGDIYLSETDWGATKAKLAKGFMPLTKAIAALPTNGAQAAKTRAAQAGLESLQGMLRATGKLLNSPDFNAEDYKPFLDRLSQAMHRLAAGAGKRNELHVFRNTIETIMSDITNYNIEQNKLLTHELFNHFYEAILELTDNLIAWIYGSCVVEEKTQKKLFKTIWHDLRSQPERVRHCVCAGLGTGLVVIIWFTTGWEGGICAVVSALVVAADFSLKKINLKIGLRFAGSLIGSLVAMLLVILVVKNTVMLMVCLFVGVAVFGYYATGNFKEMYFSWMATMSYVITLIPSNQMENNFDFMIERAAGLLFGLGVMWFVMNFFFQVNPDEVMKRYRRRLSGKLAEFFIALGQLANHERDSQNRLVQVIQYLREQAGTGDTIAKETGNTKNWQPLRETLLRTFWSTRYLKKTTVLCNQELSDEQKAIFLACCEAAAAHLHPQQSALDWPTERLPNQWEAAGATLFFSEFNELLTQVEQLELEPTCQQTPAIPASAA
jgi:uncharacterized membrane protein YccC